MKYANVARTKEGKLVPSESCEGLATGTKIKIIGIDKYGWCGRDYHPRESDVGRTGKIAFLETCDSVGKEYVKVYHVIMNDGNPLELCDFEFKVMR